MGTAGLAHLGSTGFMMPRDVVTPGFHDLYKQYSVAVFRTALRVTGNAADAEDVLQNVFLRILDHRLAPDPGGSPDGRRSRSGKRSSRATMCLTPMSRS